MKKLISTIFIILYFNNTHIIGMDYSSNPPNDTAYYCFITDMFIEEGEHFIKIKPVNFLWGLSAIIEARKDGVADYDIDKITNDTTWWVPNDYHIVDRDPSSELKFIVSDKVKVSICDPVELKKATIKELKIKIEKIEYRPFEIAVENGKVTIIKEIYIP